AVALSAWFGGLGPGLASTAFSVLAILFFFMPPIFSIDVGNPVTQVRLILFALVALLIDGLSYARTGAERATRKERAELQVTQASIGDAVITTDAQGRISFINAVAEELTGWPQADAHGKDLME